MQTPVTAIAVSPPFDLSQRNSSSTSSMYSYDISNSSTPYRSQAFNYLMNEPTSYSLPALRVPRENAGVYPNVRSLFQDLKEDGTGSAVPVIQCLEPSSNIGGGRSIFNTTQTLPNQTLPSWFDEERSKYLRKAPWQPHNSGS